jgi:hypothetical protein
VYYPDVRVFCDSNRSRREVRAGAPQRSVLSAERVPVAPAAAGPTGRYPPLGTTRLGSAARANGRLYRRVSEAACARLLQHPWPGNAELDNLMQRTSSSNPEPRFTKGTCGSSSCSVASTVLPQSLPCGIAG